MPESPCSFHPDRMTVVACSNCGRPICPDDMIDAAVGVHCPVCAGRMREGRLGAASYRVRARAERSPVVRSASRLSIVRVLLAINVGVFVLIAFAGGGGSAIGRGPDPLTLLRFGALPPQLPADEWWRIFSSMFVHIGLLHLGFNMLALTIFGSALEERAGRARFIALYLESGMLGAAASLVFTEGGVRAGASGAVFGILGAWMAFFLVHRRSPGGREQLQSLIMLVAINLVLGATLGGIDNAAHVGGLIAGLFIGAGAELSGRVPPPLRRPVSIAPLVAVPVLAVMMIAPNVVSV